MKKVLGLDIGVASIGWAFIQVEDKNIIENKSKILKTGVKVIPLSPDEKKEFMSGSPITKTQNRTTKRQIRRGLQRYKIRRRSLLSFFSKHAVLIPDSLIHLSKLEIWKLRADAATKVITKEEIARVLFHINQKRGYKSSRKDGANGDPSKSEYLAQIQNNHLQVKSKTVGQYVHEQLKLNEHFLYKQSIFLRADYLNEFNQIIEIQSKAYPDLLSDKNIKRLRDEIIFYQRPLKSQKHLVGKCIFETNLRCVPVSSPLFESSRIWQEINQLEFYNYKTREIVKPNLEVKKKLFETLQLTKEITKAKLHKIFELSDREWKCNREKIKGHTTFFQLYKTIVDKIDGFDLKSDAIVQSFFKFDPTVNLDGQASYRLWHLLFSVDDLESTKKSLKNNFNGITNSVIDAIVDIQFKQGYGSLSAKALRKIYPFLEQGKLYSEACDLAGYNHSNSITKDENNKRILLDKMPSVRRKELRNPIVEKIVNHTINLVNSIISSHDLGRPDEVRVELARELTMTSEMRNKHIKRQFENEKYNELCRAELLAHLKSSNKSEYVSLGLLERYKLYNETSGISVYSGKKMSIPDLLNGLLEVEHIIPRSRLFDNSFSNKTLCESNINKEKGSMTAFDFMKSKSDIEFKEYEQRVIDLFKKTGGGISKKKYSYLMLEAKDISKDFVSRQLNDTRWINREIKTRLSAACRNVYTTSGQVTDYLRSEWGIDQILKNKHFEEYNKVGLAEEIKVENGDRKKLINGGEYSKREDHRHHAVDAVTIACTTQTHVARLNKLPELYLEHLKDKTKEKMYKVAQPWEGFVSDVEKSLDEIAVTFKTNLKVITKGKFRKKDKFKPKEGIKHVLRGRLHEETVYGIVNVRKKIKLDKKITLDQITSICDCEIKTLLLERLKEYQGNREQAFSSKELKNKPLVYENSNLIDVMVFEKVATVRKKITDTFDNIDDIVDQKVKEIVQARLKRFDDKPKIAFKDLEQNPIWLNEKAGIKILSVKCFARPDVRTLVPLHYTDGKGKTFNKKESILTPDSKPVDYVMPGDNHHSVIYKNKEGDLIEEVVTFFEATRRARLCEKIIKIKHELGYEFVQSYSKNEMFVFNMKREVLSNFIAKKEYSKITPHLYRSQGVSEGYYTFRQQLETNVGDFFKSTTAMEMGKFKRIQNLNKLDGVKVKISNLGEITLCD